MRGSDKMNPREQKEKTSSPSVANKDDVKHCVAQWDPARTSQKLTM